MIWRIFKLILAILNPLHMSKNTGSCIIRIDLSKLKAVLRIAHTQETAIIWEEIDNVTHTHKRENYDLNSFQHDLLIKKLRMLADKIELQRSAGDKNIITDYHVFVDLELPKLND